VSDLLYNSFGYKNGGTEGGKAVIIKMAKNKSRLFNSFYYLAKHLSWFTTNFIEKFAETFTSKNMVGMIKFHYLQQAFAVVGNV
jgi:hypothetical protein